jgi:hypothetical protein
VKLAVPVAGRITNRVVYGGEPLPSFKFVVVVLVALVLILLAGPLLVFTGRLRQAKSQGLMEYGALAIGLGTSYRSLPSC